MDLKIDISIKCLISMNIKCRTKVSGTLEGLFVEQSGIFELYEQNPVILL